MKLLIVALIATPLLAEEWQAGPLTLEVHVSRTANLFHVVDNLSNWDRYAHAQYRRHFRGLSDEDQSLLRQHAGIRRKKGWGGGLEQTFYTMASLDDALKTGVAAGHLTKAEADREALILRHFAARADGLFKQEQQRLVAFRTRIKERLPELAGWCRKISRFCHGHKARVPVYLIANPSDNNWGGGYNGGRLTVEVARVADVFPTFLHELMHAFVNRERERLKAAANSAKDLDYTTLNEGIAYALSPGLIHSGTPLHEQVGRDFAQNKPFKDPYVRFRRYGLALQPLLAEALDGDETLETFLPRALDIWRAVVALDGARTAKRSRPRAPSHYSSGPGWKILGKRVSLHSFNHSANHYKKILAQARPGKTFVLMFALDHPDKNVPEGFADLLPKPWAEIEAELQAGHVVEETGRARKLRIVLLAAPTVARLRELIKKTKLIGGARGPWFFGMGRGMTLYKALNRHMHAVHGRGVAGYEHGRGGYDAMLKRSQKGDTLILMFRGDRSETPPAAMRDLLPVPWARLQEALKAGKVLEAEGTARGFRTVLLVAETEPALIDLIRRTSLLQKP